MHKIKAKIEIIGVNPHIILPDDVLEAIFKEAGKDKGPIQIRGIINEKTYLQTLVKYGGVWRLYINTCMLKNSPKHIGELIELTVEFDPIKRTIIPHPKLTKALNENGEAKVVFDTLRPSTQLEIVRYISHLKSEESVDRNVVRVIDFLLGKERFIGRDSPY